jgi:CBS domain-containing protein
MKVNEIMTHGIEGIQANDTILHAAMRMKDFDIGSIAVFEKDDAVGILTDRDIAVRVVGQSLNPVHTSVGEVMTKDPVACQEDNDLEQAAKIMENYKVRRLLVKDTNGKVTGIVTIDDLALRGGSQLVAEVIKEVKQQIGPKR